MPTTVVHTIKASGGDYSSLSAWEAAQQRNLVSLDEIAVAECYGFVDTTAVTVSGWTTGINNYIEIRAHPSARATLPITTDGSRYLLQISTSSTVALQILQSYTRVSGLQIDCTSNSTNTIGIFPASFNTIRNSIVRTAGTSETAFGYYFQGVSNTRLQNCIGIDIAGGGSSGAFTRVFAHDNAEVQYDNCLAVFAGANKSGFRANSSTSSSIIFRNCAAVNLTHPSGGFGLSGTGIGLPSIDLVKSTNNLSTDGTAYGVNARLNQTVQFVDTASGNFRLAKTDTAALNFGVNLSTSDTGSFNDTFDGFSRGQLWSIGATQPNTSAQTVYNAKYGPPTVVTNGLVFYADTMNNRSFVSGSSRITNLAFSQMSASINAANTQVIIGGVGNAILTAAPSAFQSGIEFQLLTNFPEVNFTRADNFTMCVWAAVHKIDVDPINNNTSRGVFARGSYNGFVGINVGQFTPSSSAGLSVGTRGTGGSPAVTLKSSLVTGSNAEIFNAVLVYKSSSFEGYFNGQFMGSTSALVGDSTFQEGTPPTYGINSYGGDGGNAGPATMSFYNASIYNRALSAAEVQQNYNALRARYGV